MLLVLSLILGAVALVLGMQVGQGFSNEASRAAAFADLELAENVLMDYYDDYGKFTEDPGSLNDAFDRFMSSGSGTSPSASSQVKLRFVSGTPSGADEVAVSACDVSDRDDEITGARSGNAAGPQVAVISVRYAGDSSASAMLVSGEVRYRAFSMPGCPSRLPASEPWFEWVRR